MWNDRTECLIGKEGVEALEAASVLVVGVGGVGGHTAIMLARVGVGNLTFVDFDVVDETNINRQIVATTKTIGKLKTEVLQGMVEEINPKCNVKIFSKRFSQETATEIFSEKFDYVVDAIDSVEDKVALICYCKQNGIEIVSAMGAGNRIGVPTFDVVDVFKTENDGLAKVMRKKLRENQIKNLDVVATKVPAIKFSKQDDDKCEKKCVGSISYYPAMCGCVLAAFVIEKLLARKF